MAVTNYKAMKRIMVLYPGMFELKKDELGRHCFYFVDKRISDVPFFMYAMRSIFTDYTECDISNHKFINDTSHISLILAVNMDDDKDQKGLFNMNRDLKLCDESCMELYSHNVIIRYLKIGKNGLVNYKSYDRPAIERRSIIQNIINHG